MPRFIPHRNEGETDDQDCGNKGSPKLGITDLNVVAVGPVGYGHSIQHVSGTDTKGQPFDLTVRVTDVYRKAKGNWLIVREHVSIPVDLDTGKPDLASKP